MEQISICVEEQMVGGTNESVKKHSSGSMKTLINFGQIWRIYFGSFIAVNEN